MSKYDDLFDDTAPTSPIFADTGALDPLAELDEIVARVDQERELATILNGVSEGYLPLTVSVYGPPGTGKTLTTRRLCREFATRHDAVAVEYVNLKECRTLFSAANEILFELTRAKNGAYEGLDGVFEGIWEDSRAIRSGQCCSSRKSITSNRTRTTTPVSSSISHFGGRANSSTISSYPSA